MTVSKIVFPTNDLLISTGLNLVSCYLTISFCEQVRLCAAGAHRPKFLTRNGLFFVMAMITGFVSRFTVHLLVYSTAWATDKDGNNLPIHLSTPVILVALFISMITSWIGLFISSCDRMFAKSKKQIVNFFLEDSKKLSFKEIQSISPSKMLFILATKSWYHLFWGGVIQGSGAVILRCLFIYACSITDSHFEWNIGLIVFGVLLSFLTNIIGFWIMFRLTSLYPDQEWLRFISALILTGGSLLVGAVIGAGVTLQTQHKTFPYIPPQEGHTNSQLAGYSYGLVTSICFAFFLMIIAFCDLRSWLYQTANKVNKFEMLMDILMKENSTNNDIITAFLKKHDSLTSDNNDYHSSSFGHTSNLRSSPKATKRKFLSGCCYPSDAQIYAQLDPIKRNNDSLSATAAAAGAVEDTVTHMTILHDNVAPEIGTTAGNSMIRMDDGASHNGKVTVDTNERNGSVASFFPFPNNDTNGIEFKNSNSTITLSYNNINQKRDKEKEKEFVRSLHLQSVVDSQENSMNQIHNNYNSNSNNSNNNNRTDLEGNTQPCMEMSQIPTTMDNTLQLSPTHKETHDTFLPAVVDGYTATFPDEGQTSSEEKTDKELLTNEKVLFSTKV